MDADQSGDFGGGDARESQVWQPSQNSASVLCIGKKKVKKESKEEDETIPCHLSFWSKSVLVEWRTALVRRRESRVHHLKPRLLHTFHGVVGQLSQRWRWQHFGG